MSQAKSDIIPESGLGPQNGKWRQWVERSVTNIKSGVAAARNDTANSFKATNSSLQLLTKQIETLSGQNDVLRGMVTNLLSSGITTTSISASGNIYASGIVTGDSGLSSVGAYNTDVTALPGPRSSAWFHSSGVLGQTSSSITTKTLLDDPIPFTVTDILTITPHIFHYKSQVAIREDPNNPFYDPNYVVPHDLGMVAEHLDEAGMGLFVLFGDDGNPTNIDYALFGAVTALMVGRDHEARLKALETDRMETL